ncbi:hypothetical protein GCM10011344_14310 [Dokdonia pacifica]|uniref:Uncharacterized protein n=1 Tax=Dokdonia pacifica TaxID=1627892 RepID=A0A238W5E5_9FLAO|nr:hypothetical protein [Dokdonia pacifica]GGG14832.1 hypothetical protein GCM10011344_14310 [Dokdonia pacifica]SNR41825.1 hypothetical protein SAMN06265376_101714 [Dokdonia pacifica]
MQKNNRIDYSKYEVDEVAETISDAIFFPLYIGRILGLTVLIASVILFVYAYFQNEYILLVILLFLLLFVVSLPTIILISAIRLINRIRDDLNKVILITTETAIHVYNDTRQLGTQRSEGVSVSTSFKDVFRGVALFVIKPSLKKVLEKRIKFFALPFTFITDLVFSRLVKVKATEIEAVIAQEDIEEGAAIEEHKIMKGISKTTSITSSVLKTPFVIALVLYGIINILLIKLLILIF